jgi:hypothetical protein
MCPHVKGASDWNSLGTAGEGEQGETSKKRSVEISWKKDLAGLLAVS